MRRALLAAVATTVVSAAVLAVVPTAAASVGRTWVVPPSKSVQAAVNRAKPGDTILLLPGLYQQSVLIQTDGISLRGAGSSSGGTLFKPPANLPKGLCTKASGGAGVCVIGTLNSQFEVTRRVKGDTVSGIQFVGWPSVGVFALGTKDLRLANNAVFKSGEYGLARFDSVGGVVRDNIVVGGGEAGIYLGDSADAGAKVMFNDVSGSSYGIFVRHSSGVTVQQNHAWNNCQGILILDDGQPGGVSDIEIKYNLVTLNNATCEATDEAPALSGGGILLIGATGSTVTWNTVKGNEGTEINSGGIVLVSAVVLTGGVDPADNKVTNNSAFGNSPSDISSDGTGTGNDLSGNFCDTSSPSGACS